VGIEGDVSNIGDLDKLYNVVNDQKDQLDILFANADIIQSAPLGKISEQFYNLFDVNVKGLLFTV
jgi:NADP-dependent 3-hydroxy acid dehydrogenase YdfG